MKAARVNNSANTPLIVITGGGGGDHDRYETVSVLLFIGIFIVEKVVMTIEVFSPPPPVFYRIT
jgi:hypothetical protein